MTATPPDNAALFQSILFLANLSHLFLAGLMTAGATVVLLLSVFGTLDGLRPQQHLAGEIGAWFTLKSSTAPLLALTVGLSLLCVYGLYRPDLPATGFWAGLLLLLLTGLWLLYLARRFLLHPSRSLTIGAASGGSGIALVLLAYFLLFCGSGLLLMPEKWPHLASQPVIFLSWNAVARHLQFTSLSFAAAGAVFLLFGSRKAASEAEEEALTLARRVGFPLVLIFLLLFPPGLCFELLTLPEATLSGGIFAVNILALTVAALAVLLAPATRKRPAPRKAATLICLILALFFLWVLNDHIARENILTEATLARPPAGEKAVGAERAAAEDRDISRRRPDSRAADGHRLERAG